MLGFRPDERGNVDWVTEGGRRPTEGVRGSSPGQPLGAAAEAAGVKWFKSNRTIVRESDRHEKSQATSLAFDVSG